ncbi:MAG TPA: nuclear transport factor 2 family protein [Bacteroidia bacterium]|nr:nuclear transport factor 2 family protein [Bacteroidia bacterium]
MQRNKVSGQQQASVVSSFADAINKRDFNKVNAFLTESHLFIPATKNVIQGREKTLDYWKNLLKKNPDYKIEVSKEIMKDGVAFMLGYVKGNGVSVSNSTPVCWKARVHSNSIALLKEYDEFGDMTLL